MRIIMVYDFLKRGEFLKCFVLSFLHAKSAKWFAYNILKCWTTFAIKKNQAIKIKDSILREITLVEKKE